ncbi:MAG: hypothetical protein WAL56_07990 [Candidatus Sulfotelmatobacter sp.]
MRRGFLFSLIVLSAVGMAFSQDTNFATGPQYLMTNGSMLFARPISTPSLSLAGPPLQVGATSATADLTAGAENQTVSLPPADALPVVDFFSLYYGTPNLIEISFSNASSSTSELPASILDNGVWQLTTAEALRERGFGVTLPEAAAYRKTHPRHATHVYTNADIDRLKN